MTASASPQPIVVAPSLLSADFARLGEEVAAVEAGGADWLHLDVMDNHYVPNLTFGAPLCGAVRACTTLPIDVHLMTQKVETLIEPFAAAGADRITFHPDSTAHAHRVLTAIHGLSMQAGVALNPAMSYTQIECLLADVELILIMTVNPGFGGQAFIEGMLDKIAFVRQKIDDSGRAVRLQVDGGINPETAARARAAGADTLVAGHAVFRAPDYADAIGQIRGA